MNAQYYLKQLFELLSIPSISAQSEHKKDMKRCTEWLQKKLVSLGFKVNILPTNGHPVVYAELISNVQSLSEPEVLSGRRPTVLIYGHYDVQDPGNLNEWSSNPFKPEIRSGNIYARGAADNKGQLYTWIAALEEMLYHPSLNHPRGVIQINNNNKDHTPGVYSFPNIKFLIEGEEEVGSSNLDDFIADNTALLKSDICVISDTHNLSEAQPMIDYGLRGLVYMEMVIKTLAKDVHSGLYGGNVLNPANVLASIISKLKDDNHKVLIPGFYDNVRKLSSNELKQLEKLPFTEKDITSETGALVTAGEKEFGYHARAGARPTLDVNGIWSGYTGDGPKTIIPSEAYAKISMRLVPHQTSTEIKEKFITYITSLVPEGAEVEIKVLSTGEPILIDTHSTYFEAAEKAYERVFGTKPVYELSGGSIPVTAVFKTILGIDSILMGYGLPDDGLHSPNEKLSVSMFEKGIRTNIEFLTSL